MSKQFSNQLTKPIDRPIIQSGIFAGDDGGEFSKIMTKDSFEIVPSTKGAYGSNRTLNNNFGKHDFIVEYENKKYIMGKIATYDCKFPMRMHSRSKADIFFDLNVLVGIHQWGYPINYVVLSAPIDMLTDEERKARVERLVGRHTITVNEVTKTFVIEKLILAPETASAFWIEEPYGKTRFLDLGSRTIGYATTLNQDGEVRFIDEESGTYFGYGLEAIKDKKGYCNEEQLASYICGDLLKFWNREDNVMLLGGGALREPLVREIRKYFPNARVMENPQMANVRGMYLLARDEFNML